MLSFAFTFTHGLPFEKVKSRVVTVKIKLQFDYTARTDDFGLSNLLIVSEAMFDECRFGSFISF